MAKAISALVDTDVFIDYFNHQLFREIFDQGAFVVYYSIVTKKELLSKEGLSGTEKRSIRRFLQRCRIIPLTQPVLLKFAELRQKVPHVPKEDCLIAATAITKRLPLVTRNVRHYRPFAELKLLFW